MSLSVLERAPTPTRPRTRVKRVALAGCGVVGGELARLLAGNPAYRIVSVLVRDPAKERGVALNHSVFTTDVDEFLRADADIIVEAIGGLSPADRIARSAVQRGIRFVTANKALIAECGAELLNEARLSGARVDFEAAVGGGVPIIRALRSSLQNARVRRVTAILNGTTNYILSQIERGASFPVALAEAQKNGFAEADSTRDLNGTDSSDKLRILAWLAFGVNPNSVTVECRGVLPDPASLVRAAAKEGKVVRLIAECEQQGSEILARVEPRFFARDSVFARTTDEQNLVSVDLGWSSPLVFTGPGAGGLPTATALLGDLIAS